VTTRPFLSEEDEGGQEVANTQLLSPASAVLPAGERVAISVRAVLELAMLGHYVAKSPGASAIEDTVLDVLLDRILLLANAALSALTDEVESPADIAARTFEGRP